MPSAMGLRVISVLYAVCQHLAKVARPPSRGLLPAVDNRLVRYVSEVFSAVAHRNSEVQGRQITRPKLHLHLADFTDDMTGALEGKKLYIIIRAGAGDVFRTPLRRREPRQGYDEKFFVNIGPTTIGNLVVEIWEAQDTARHDSIRKTCQGGAANVIRNIWNSIRPRRRDQLLGVAAVPLADVPDGDNESWYEVWYGHSRSIGIKVGVCFKEDVPRLRKASTARKDHQRMAEAFLMHSLETDAPRTLNADAWIDCLPREGVEILHRHAAETGLRTTAIFYLQAVISVQRTIGGRLKCSVLRDLLETLNSELGSFTNDLGWSYRKVLKEIARQARALVCMCYEKFGMEDEQASEELESAFACCQLVGSLINSEVLSSTYRMIRTCAKKRLRDITSPGLPDVTEDSFLESVQDTLSSIADFYVPANATFERAAVISHLEITVKELDNLLYALFKPSVVRFSSLIAKTDSERKTALVEKSLEMFRLLRSFVDSTLQGVLTRSMTLRMEDPALWFSASVLTEWFVLIGSKQAREADRTATIPCPSDTTDTTVSSVLKHYEQLFALWESIRPSDLSVATAFAESLASCAVTLAVELKSKLRNPDRDSDSYVPHAVQAAINDLVIVKAQLMEGELCIASRVRENKLQDVLPPLETAYKFLSDTVDCLRSTLRADNDVDSDGLYPSVSACCK